MGLEDRRKPVPGARGQNFLFCTLPNTDMRSVSAYNLSDVHWRSRGLFVARRVFGSSAGRVGE
jgi:hypothetical protein